MFKVSYQMFRLDRNGWDFVGTMSEREAMAQYLKAPRGFVKFVEVGTDHEATWEDYRR